MSWPRCAARDRRCPRAMRSRRRFDERDTGGGSSRTALIRARPLVQGPFRDTGQPGKRPRTCRARVLVHRRGDQPSSRGPPARATRLPSTHRRLERRLGPYSLGGLLSLRPGRQLGSDCSLPGRAERHSVEDGRSARTSRCSRSHHPLLAAVASGLDVTAASVADRPFSDPHELRGEHAAETRIDVERVHLAQRVRRAGLRVLRLASPVAPRRRNRAARARRHTVPALGGQLTRRSGAIPEHTSGLASHPQGLTRFSADDRRPRWWT